MKIVCVENVFSDGQTYVSLRPDTSVLRNNDDFYVPHFSTNIVCGCAVLVRITRLAKCLDARFASRCYDAIGVGVTFVARDMMRKALSEGRPCEEAYTFDRSFAVSPEMKEPLLVGEGCVQMWVNDTVVQSFTIGKMLLSIDECVSRASRSLTLKTGDIVAVPMPADIAVCLGDNLRVSLDGASELNFIIK
jgi:2-keto-4-pentenoate hydratase/2-oxohepta-3-ene-1,7-dioic acid hydratase in catechol pathway